jgi:hypothetical protein
MAPRTRMPLVGGRSLRTLVLCCGVAASTAAHAGMIPVRHPQGSAHGFVEITKQDGSRIGIGDLLQRVHGNVVTSRLVMHFFDGSLDDETTVYSQREVCRFISDRHVQQGPSFPTAVDVTIDATKGRVTSRDDKGRTREDHLQFPPDVYNGMASSLLMNVSPSAAETKIAVVVAAGKPRIVHLSMKPAGEVSFSIGGKARQAMDFVVHVELGGVAGLVAPLIGKEPLDYHLWLVTGSDPAFIREEGQLYQGGPVWRIQQISASFAP